MIGFQPCFICQLNRRLVSAEPVTREYELQFLECPKCKSLARLVQKRSGANKLPQERPLRTPAVKLKAPDIAKRSPGSGAALATG